MGSVIDIQVQSDAKGVYSGVSNAQGVHLDLCLGSRISVNGIRVQAKDGSEAKEEDKARFSAKEEDKARLCLY